jgi:hypothetical protein
MQYSYKKYCTNTGFVAPCIYERVLCCCRTMARVDGTDKLSVTKKCRIIARTVVKIKGNKSREKEGRLHEKQHQDIKNRVGKNTF